MKFNLEERVTGADLKSGGVLLVLPRAGLQEILLRLQNEKIPFDAFCAEGDSVTAAVFPEEEFSFESLGISPREEIFRLTVRGDRLSEGRLAELWDSVLKKEGITPLLPCADCNGFCQYFPLAVRPEILSLLFRVFGIREA